MKWEERKSTSVIVVVCLLISLICYPVSANDLSENSSPTVLNQEPETVAMPEEQAYVSDCPVAQIAITCTQPSGVSFVATQKGTASFSYVVTDNGHMLQKDGEGYWCYMEEQVQTENGLREMTLSSNRYLIEDAPNTVITEDMYVRDRDLQVSETLKTSLGDALHSCSSDMQTANLSDDSIAQLNTTSTRAATTGDIPLLVILVSFSDIQIQGTHYQWRQAFFGSSNKSVKDYYLSTSNNTINFVPAKETSGTANDGIVFVTLNQPHPVQNSTDDQFGSDQSKQAALDAAGQYVNCAQYADDNNNMSQLKVMLIFAGYEKSCSENVDKQYIYGHHSYGSFSMRSNDTDYTFSGLSCVAEIHKFELESGVMSYHRATIGILTHELGHALGLPDLYEPDCSNIDTFSLMSYNWTKLPGEEYIGTTPPQLDAYCKIELGIYTPQEINYKQTGSFSVSIYTETDKTRAYKIPTNNSSEYYLVENRTYLAGATLGTSRPNYDEVLSVDENRNGTGGLAIYYVNTYGESVNMLRASVWKEQVGDTVNICADEVYYIGDNVNQISQPTRMNNADLTPGADAQTKRFPWFTLKCTSAVNRTMSFEITANEVVLGDVDGDGYVTSSDSTLALQIAIDNATVDVLHLDAADVDGEEGVTTTDARLILQYASGILSDFTRIRDDDYGDTREKATPKLISATGITTWAGTIERVGDRDMFRFTAPSTGTFEISSQNAYYTFSGVLYNSTGAVLKRKNGGGTLGNFSFSYTLTAGSTYYLEVYYYSNDRTRAYQINVAPEN